MNDETKKRLELLERTVGDFNDQIVRCNDEIATLMARNAELESKNNQLESKNTQLEGKHHDTERSLSELKKLVANNNPNVKDSDFVSMNPNAYTFLYTSVMWSGPFLAAMATCILQYTVFSLFLADLLNTSKLPPDVATIVRVCQALAIIIAFLVETDMLSALRGVIYREGLKEMADDFDGFSAWKFSAANALMGLQGLLGKAVAFFLIIFADNVFDLLLNFTAVMFVSQLDEALFVISMTGYAGRKAEILAKDIQKVKLPQRPPGGILQQLHLCLYGYTMIGAFIAFGFIARRQNSQESLAQFVKVQFGDEVDPTLGLFSGCYEKQLNDGWDARVRYVQTQPDRGQGDFEYCLDDSLQTWVFANKTSETACDGKFSLRSAEERSTSFDLLDSKGDQWLLSTTGNPISEFQMGEIDPSRFETECGNIAVTRNDEEVCPVLTLNADGIGFAGSHDWSRTYVLLENLKNEAIQFYQRPVFVGESIGIEEGYEMLFFTGRRWAITSAKKLMQTESDTDTDASDDSNSTNVMKDPSNKTNIISLFEASDFRLLNLPAESLAYLSEAVSQGNDRGTPLGLQWYNARYADGVAFPFADFSRPVDASFRCGKCNSRNNPCLYEGICEGDGTCTCSHGASGKLCEIKPLGDGVCNQFFNRASDQYDGGDCCVATCSETNCGVNGTNFAFGQHLPRSGVGFPQCINASMVPLTIVLETEFENIWSVFLGPYTVQVACEEGAQVPLRVALDPSIAGKHIETLFLEDKTESCLLSFTIVSSAIGHKIHYQIMDGLDSSAESMLLMREEKNVTTDGQFSLPDLYSRCLKESLAGAIDLKNLYTGNYQDEAFAWLDNEEPKYPDCRDREYVVERYALVALSAAEEATESWISSIDHCLWPRVACDGPRVVELNYNAEINGPLKGLWAHEFLLLRHLEKLHFVGNEFSQGTIPTEIGELTALTRLLFAGNQRTGALPSEIFGLSALQEVSFAYNALSGTLPSEIGNRNALVRLALMGNEISGTLPSEVGESALTALHLSENNLVGNIPSEIGKLSGLQELNLQSNRLSGTIPSEVWNLSSFTIVFLADNALSGTVPSEVGYSSALERLQLFSNALSGFVPSEVGNLSALISLVLSDNAFSGSIPSEVGKLIALTDLVLSNNVLSGTIPSEVGKMSALKGLGLSGNGFSGTIPSEVGKLSALTKLLLFDNGLSGTIPSLEKLSALDGLALHNNAFFGTVPLEVWTLRALKYIQLNNNVLNGTLPSEIGNLNALEQLHLYSNAVSGSLPSEIGTMNALTMLYLDGNVMSHTIPSEVGNLRALAQLHLHNNVLTGRLPSEVGSLSALAQLYLYNNALSGNVPSEIGSLSALEALQMNNNKLSGTIPSEIGNLGVLESLWLSDNLLSASIPSEVGNMSALAQLALQNNTLSGSLPSEIGLLDTLIYLNLGDNAFVSSLPSEIGLLTNLQYLILSGNMFNLFPTEILRLSSLKHLDLSGNVAGEQDLPACDETSVVMSLTTDAWPGETTWEISTQDGAVVVASNGGYLVRNFAHKRNLCIPSDGCTLTVFDHFQDGGPTVEITRLGKEYKISGIFTDKAVVDICS